MLMLGMIRTSNVFWRIENGGELKGSLRVEYQLRVKVQM